jgi:ubiquinone/menaquinone biosynthesis C-methylase UbiE
MTATQRLEPSFPIPDDWMKAAYQFFQTGKSGFSITHKTLSNRLRNIFVPDQDKNIKPLSPEILSQLNQKRVELLEADWQDAQDGVYPVSLLFDSSFTDFLLYYPAIWLDIPKSWQLIRDRQYQAFAPEIDREGYPPYYLQNFHFQVDGYLSEMSANLYDLQVEILFNGTADAMRRRILKPTKNKLAALADTSPRQVRMLDVACGTGRTLRMLRSAFPKAALFGIDLSPAYLCKANQLLSEMAGELPQLMQGDGEALPYRDNYFHTVTSVFLFHELPPEVRQKVFEECFRVMQPGGVFVLCDSIQMLDSPELATMMDNFPVTFHEPYYQHYVTDDIAARLAKAGFEDITMENYFVSKYWVACKPVI